MPDDSGAARSTTDIQLHDETRLNELLKWYDQQIVLAAKSKELSELKTAIAKARAEEAFALVQVARITSLDPEEETKEEEKVN